MTSAVDAASSEEGTAARTRRLTASPLVAFLVFAPLLGAIQLSIPDLAGVDAYHHLKVAQLLGREEISPVFRWTAESTWATAHADKDLLLHALLVPFVRIGERYDAVVAMGKLAGTLLAAGVMAVFVRLLAGAGVAHPLWWAMLLIAGAPSFTGRLSLVRPHLLGIALSLGTLDAMWRGRRVQLFVCALVYPVAYTASHTALAMAALVAIGRAAFARAWSPVPLVLVPVGLALGFVAHPHFPLNVESWWAQNVRVPALADQAPALMRKPAELGPFDSDLLVREDQVLSVAWFLCLALALARPRPVGADTQDAFLLASAFGVMTLLATRFLEYWAPYTVIFAALVWRDLIARAPDPGWRTVWARRLALPLVVVLLPFGVARCVGVLRQLSGRNEGYAAVARLIDSAHRPRATRVFHSSWGLYPGLFFHDHHSTYLVGLDPAYFYLASPDRFRRWREVCEGRVERPAEVIAREFLATWIVSESGPLEAALAREGVATLVGTVSIPRPGGLAAERLKVYRIGD